LNVDTAADEEWGRSRQQMVSGRTQSAGARVQVSRVPSDITRTISSFEGVLTVVTRQLFADSRDGDLWRTSAAGVRPPEDPGEQLGPAGDTVVAVQALHVLVDRLATQAHPGRRLLLAIPL
jgi:hypothetical protein